MGATGILNSIGSISRLCTASARMILWCCASDTACTPSISGFDAAVTACIRGFTLLILPALAVLVLSVVSNFSVLAVFGLPVLQYCQYSHCEIFAILRLRNVRDTPTTKSSLYSHYNPRMKYTWIICDTHVLQVHSIMR